MQGRYDVVCPMESAWALHRAWPEAELIISPDSGHSAMEPSNSRALVAATDKFAASALVRPENPCVRVPPSAVLAGGAFSATGDTVGGWPTQFRP